MPFNVLARILLIAVVTAPWAGNASAGLLKLSPTMQTVGVGEQVAVDIEISGLGDGIAPSLGAYFIELVFDETILQPELAMPTAALGDIDPLLFETDILVGISTDSVAIDVFSFLTDVELDPIQGSAFSLATVFFSTLASGTSLIDFGDFDLSIARGEVLVPDTESASVMVRSSVPSPASVTLVLCGLIGLRMNRGSVHMWARFRLTK